MPQKKATPNLDGQKEGYVNTAQYRAMVAVMDELSFRGPMQEALVMRIANAGGISEVITTIKRRRLYSKKMRDGAQAVADVPGVPVPPKRAKKKATRKARPTTPPAGGDQSGEGTEGE